MEYAKITAKRYKCKRCWHVVKGIRGVVGLLILALNVHRGQSILNLVGERFGSA
jgi:hypothetical protein